MTLHLTQWGSEVVEGTVLGEPCRVFARRPTHLGQLVDESARHADRVHLVQGDRRMTFSELAEAARVVGTRLRAEGAGAGDRIVLLGANSLDWVVTFWACLTNDLVLIPGNAWWSADEAAHAVRTTQARLAVADERRRERLPDSIPCLDLTTVLDICRAESGRDDSGRDDSGSCPPSRAAEDDPAMILFTSGTTSFPKGATLTHGNLLANLQNLLAVAGRLPGEEKPGRPASVTLMTMPLFHIGGIQQLLTAIVSGNTLVFLDGRFDAERMLGVVEAERVTVWSAVPTMVTRVLDALDANPGRFDVTSLRTLVMGGSPVPDGLRARAAAAFPNITRGLGVSYGLTEVSGVVATAAGPDVLARPGTVGRLLPTVEARIDDADGDGVGELLVRSPGVMKGYWGIDDDPVLTEGRWLRTGDLARLDADGWLSIVGRSKDVVIRGGENIATVRVEDRLAEHPAVLEVAVVGLPHPELGEELAAAVVLRDGAVADHDELARFAAEMLAYFEVPTRWWFPAELPKNATGKILKREVAGGWPVIR
ncbi:MAG: class I adenylate-forming enzyme family protein [Actinomycetota bacterium]